MDTVPPLLTALCTTSLGLDTDNLRWPAQRGTGALPASDCISSNLMMLSGPWSCCVKRSISADLVTALRLLLSCDYE